MSLTLSGSGTIGGLVAGGLPDATVTNAELVTMDGAKVTGDIAAAQITSALNASGSAPVYACRAWVNFNGQGTVAIRASGNVSSITDNATGNYTVNFTTAMPDANYNVMISGDGYGVVNAPVFNGGYVTRGDTPNYVVCNSTNGSTNIDIPVFSIAIFR